MYMAISALLFSCYFLNVSMGAFGGGVILSDIQELLLLIVSVIFFVAAILLREAVKKTSDK
jgi:hypothetical protein